MQTYLVPQGNPQPRVMARHDPRIEPAIVVSGDEVLGLALGGSTDLDGVGIRREGQGAEGQGVGEVDGMEGDNHWNHVSPGTSHVLMAVVMKTYRVCRT